MLKDFIFNLPVNKKVIFSNHKNIYKKGIEKRQRQLLVKLPFLPPFLEPDEEVLLATTGYSQVFNRAQLFTLWLFIYLKRSLFIFTNKRIFHIPTTVKYSYRNSISQIRYSGSQLIYLKGRSLVVECKICHHKIKFIGIRKKEKKKINAFLKTVKPDKDASLKPQITHLCPGCTRDLIPGKYSCFHCRLKFKSKLKTMLFSLLLPGGGYFYIGHYFLGIIDLIIEGVFYYYIYNSIIGILNNAQNSTLFLVLTVFLFIMKKIISCIHASHFTDEFIPILRSRNKKK